MCKTVPVNNHYIYMGRYKLWCEDDMETALSLVRDGMNVNAASRLTSVPRRTLRYRLARGYYNYVSNYLIYLHKLNY